MDLPKFAVFRAEGTPRRRQRSCCWHVCTHLVMYWQWAIIRNWWVSDVKWGLLLLRSCFGFRFAFKISKKYLLVAIYWRLVCTHLLFVSTYEADRKATDWQLRIKNPKGIKKKVEWTYSNGKNEGLGGLLPPHQGGRVRPRCSLAERVRLRIWPASQTQNFRFFF